jgi:hypothetical protein
LPFDLDVRLIQPPTHPHRPLAAVERSFELGTILHHPTVDGGVVDRHTALLQQLVDLTRAQGIGDRPPHTGQATILREMGPREARPALSPCRLSMGHSGRSSRSRKFATDPPARSGRAAWPHTAAAAPRIASLPPSLPRHGVGPPDPVGPGDRLPPPVVRSCRQTHPDRSSPSPHGPPARRWVACELLSPGARQPSHSTPTERTGARQAGGPRPGGHRFTTQRRWACVRRRTIGGSMAPSDVPPPCGALSTCSMKHDHQAGRYTFPSPMALTLR